ncbi:MAG: PAS domain S-box protein, partial [Nitrospinales bacterium]
MEELDLFKSDKLALAVESLAESVVITDPGGTITYVNPAFESITGYSAAEAIGKNPRILKSGQNPPELYKDMWNTLLEGKRWKGRVINKRKDGSTFIVDLTISPIWSKAGRILYYVAVQHELTEKLNAEEKARLVTQEYEVLHEVAKALHTSEGTKPMLENVLKALTHFEELKVEYKAGIFLADEEKKVLHLFAYVGNFSKEFLEKDKEVPYGECLCGRAAASGEMIVSNDCFTDDRHDRIFDDMTSHGHYIVPLQSHDKLIGILFLYTDPHPPWYERSQEILLSIGGLIADGIEQSRAEERQKKTNQELTVANEKLKDLNELKNEFLGIAAHDLRNPLYLIQAYSEALIQRDSFGSLTEKQKKILKIVLSSSKEMGSLLNDLLDISIIESGKVVLKKKKANLNTLLKKRIEFYQLMAHKKNIELHLNLGQVPVCSFDENRIIQSVDNLISNAIKYSPPKSNVYITTQQKGNSLEVSVRDEG